MTNSGKWRRNPSRHNECDVRLYRETRMTKPDFEEVLKRALALPEEERRWLLEQLLKHEEENDDA